MSKIPTIEDVKRRHTDLYNTVLRSGSSPDEVRTAIAQSQLLPEIDSLLGEIEVLSSQVSTFEDYQWLLDAAMQWQVAQRSFLGISRTIRLTQPDDDLILPPRIGGTLSAEEIQHFIRRVAQVLGYARVAALGRISSEEEMKRDWRFAGSIFAHDVLDGKINFASRIGRDCYWYLQNEWLKYVKCIRAYLSWEQRHGVDDPCAQDEDYFEACKHFRDLLVNRGIKALPSEFDEPEMFLRNSYLTRHGKLNRDAPGVKALVGRKADRIAGTTGHTDPIDNWFAAETYVQMFYENIIPAVRRRETDETLVVLKAFQFSKVPEHRYRVVDCFESALAIYFLDADVIEALWAKSENEPTPASHVRSVMKVSTWLPGFKIPGDCKGRFDVCENEVSFRGVMSTSQRDSLCASARNVAEKKVIDDLFKQSRLIHRETTL